MSPGNGNKPHWIQYLNTAISALIGLIFLYTFFIRDPVNNGDTEQQTKTDEIYNLLKESMKKNEESHKEMNQRIQKNEKHIDLLEKAAWKNWPSDRDFLNKPPLSSSNSNNGLVAKTPIKLTKNETEDHYNSGYCNH